MRDPDLVARAWRAATRRTEPLPEGTAERARPTLLGAPIGFGVGRRAPDRARDMATELCHAAVVCVQLSLAEAGSQLCLGIR